MRVAILISGRFYKTFTQDYEKCLVNEIKKNNKDCEFDVYLHIWKTDIWGAFYNETAKNVFAKENTNEDIDKILAFYKPKQYIIKDMMSDVFKKNNFNNSAQVIIYNLKSLFSMTNDEDYDAYIFVRPDLYFTNYNLFINNLHISNHKIVCYNGGYDVPLCDWMFIMNKDSIKSLCEINFNYNNLPNETNIYNNIINNNFSVDKIGSIDTNIKLRSYYLE